VECFGVLRILLIKNLQGYEIIRGKSGTVLVIQEQRGLVLVSLHKRVGQFVSPLVVIPLSHNLFGADLTAPYKVAILLCLVFLVQVWATRHF
jgi:hypothetical protein